jgi:hypothetical protein
MNGPAAGSSGNWYRQVLLLSADWNTTHCPHQQGGKQKAILESGFTSFLSSPMAIGVAPFLLGFHRSSTTIMPGEPRPFASDPRGVVSLLGSRLRRLTARQSHLIARTRKETATDWPSAFHVSAQKPASAPALSNPSIGVAPRTGVLLFSIQLPYRIASGFSLNECDAISQVALFLSRKAFG